MRTIVFLVLAAVLLCTGAAPAQSVATLHLAGLPIDASAELFYATDEGYFTAAGLDTTTDTMANGGAVAAAVVGGTIDIGFANVFSLVQAYAHGLPVTLLAGAGESVKGSPTAQIVVAKDSPIRTAKDLDGKVFGTEGLRTISEFAPRNWIDRNGGDSSTVKFVELAFPETQAALEAHRVDAVMLPEPFITYLKPQTRIIGDAYPAIADRFLIGAFFTTTSWAKAHPDAVRRFRAAIARAAAFGNAQHDASAQILARHSKIPPSALAAMNRVHYATTLTPDLVQPMIDLCLKYHAIDHGFPAQTMIAAE